MSTLSTEARVPDSDARRPHTLSTAPRAPPAARAAPSHESRDDTRRPPPPRARIVHAQHADPSRYSSNATRYRIYHVFPALGLAPPRSEAASVPANRPLLVNTVLVACVFTRSRGRPLASPDGAACAGRCFLGGGASSRVFSTGLPLASSVHSTGCAALALPFFLCDREVPKSTCSPHRASNPAMNASSASGKYALG